MDRSLLLLSCAPALTVLAGCASRSPYSDDGYLNCLTASQLKSVPMCKATVEKIAPCSVRLKTDDGHSISLAGPGGADRAVLNYMDTLEKGHTYTLPDDFLAFLKK